MRILLILTVAVSSLAFGSTFAANAERNPASGSQCDVEKIAQQIKSKLPDGAARDSFGGAGFAQPQIHFTNASSGEADWTGGCPQSTPGVAHCFAIIAFKYDFQLRKGCKVAEVHNAYQTEGAPGDNEQEN